MSPHVAAYSKPIVKQVVSQKTKHDALENDSAAEPEPERKQGEALSRSDPRLKQYCDDGHGNAIAVGYARAPSATLDQR
jgi:hypothetical protein